MIQRAQQVQAWLDELGLPPLLLPEALALAQPATVPTVCDAFQDLIDLCRHRYAHQNIWPDFSILKLTCPGVNSDKKRRHAARIFAIGVPSSGQTQTQTQTQTHSKVQATS